MIELKDRLGVDRWMTVIFSSLSLPGSRASTSIIGVASSSYFGIVFEGSGVDNFFCIKHSICCYLFWVSEMVILDINYVMNC